MKKIFRHWKIIYALFCLVYMGWVMHVGTNEFDRINGQYRRLVAQLDAELIRSRALEELTAECFRKSGKSSATEGTPCLSWPSGVVEAKARKIEKLRIRARERGAVKLVLFYTGFVVIFLLAPPVLIYLLLIGIITLYRNIKIVR